MVAEAHKSTSLKLFQPVGISAKLILCTLLPMAKSKYTGKSQLRKQERK
jgi:hypothetical protein